MRKTVDRILHCHGTGGQLLRGEAQLAVRCFFYPVNSTSRQSMVKADSPLGLTGQGKYIYIGPAEPEAREGDTLKLGQREYLLRRVEPYYYRDEVMYYWALCDEKGGGALWEN